MNDQSPEAEIVLVPHTHWDREWYEPHDVFRLRLVHVLDDVVARLEDDPDFRFTLDGQSAAIGDYLEIRPEQRERVESLVRDGRLAIGPFLILLDEFCCDGETIVRNLELGRALAEDLGGAMAVGYLPDMFGHAAQLPQILRGFGIEHAALWRGVPADVGSHGFAWAAPDGSVVRCEYLFDGYGSALDLFAVRGQLEDLARRYRGDTRSWYGADPVLGMLGTDHSAPQRDLMDVVREHNARPGAVPLAVAALPEYLGRRDTSPAALAKLPLVRGELRSHARGNLLPGVFSIRTNLKAAMARAELTLTRAERLDALYGAEDHRAFFDLAWRRVVECTAHDSITGCGVDETADQVAARLASATHIGRAVLERVAGQTATGVPADAHLVLNTLPWERTVQAEIVQAVPDDAAAPETGVRVQRLAELETVLGDEQLATADLVKILRRIHGRELFGQLITGYSWSESALRFEVAEVAEGTFDLAQLTQEIEEATVGPDRAWHVTTIARRRERLLVEATVPALGGTAVRPGDGRAGTPAAVTVDPDARRLGNGLIAVVVHEDGTAQITGEDGTVLDGVGRLVDEGDRGDSYNFGPLAQAQPVSVPQAVRIAVREHGPLRGVIEVERRYVLPAGVSPEDRNRRIDATAELVTTMLVELRTGEPFVRLTLETVNTVADHRLRLHVPLGASVTGSASSGQFAVTRRARTAEGGWGEFPLPTFPATGFVSAGAAHVLLGKLTEYEVVTPQDGVGDELALTVLRAVGLMSVNVHPLRDEPAGSQLPVPGAQYLGVRVTSRIAVMAHAGGWEEAAADRWAEHFRHEPVVARGANPAGGPLPAAHEGLRLDGRAVLTSLRRVDGDELELRLVALGSQPARVRVTMPDPRAWRQTDLRGAPLDGPVEQTDDGTASSIEVSPSAICTLRGQAVTRG